MGSATRETPSTPARTRQRHISAHSDTVDEILKGSWDLHVHSRPDPEDRLRLDALDTARRAQETGMAGFVLKSHYYPTAPVAEILTRVYPGLTVVGAVALNDEVGGLNARAVESAAKTGARVVWMPTFSAHHFTTRQSGQAGIEIAIDGRLVPEVLGILEVARSHELIVASGHVSPAEAILLFRAAGEMGIMRLIASHPTHWSTTEEMVEMARLGAYVEHTFLSCMPSRARTTPSELASLIGTLGVERCVVTSDFGQWMNPPPAEGMRMAIAELLNAGMSPGDVTTVVKTNPEELVGAG